MDLTPPLVVWITGFSGAGKTTLIEQLIPELTALGLATGTLKHHHRMRVLDRPGTDTARHAAAGAAATILAGPAGAALFLPTPPPLAALLDQLTAAAAPDLVLVEGFTDQARIAIALVDREQGRRPLPAGCEVLAELALPAARTGRRPRFARAGLLRVVEVLVQALPPRPRPPHRPRKSPR